MKRHCATFLFILFATIAHAQSAHPTELLKNPSFEEEAAPIRNRRFGPNGEGELFGGYLPEGIILGWIIPDGKEEASTIEVTTDNLPDTTQHKALRWHITHAPATVTNVGFQGIEVTSGTTYALTFWARAEKRYRGKLLVGLQDKAGDTWYAQATPKGKVKKRWRKYTLTFAAQGDDERARFAITASKPGTLYIDCVSLTVQE